MSKASITASVVIVGILVTIGIAGFLTVNKNTSKTTSPTSADSNESDLNTAEPQNTSLRNLMNMADNQHCTYSDVESDSQGEVYVADGKMRGNFTSTSEVDTQISHMFLDGQDIYVWFDGAEDGFKSSMADIEKVGANISTEKNKTVDINKTVDFNCDPWVFDNSVFQIPAIKFEDFGAMIKDMEGMDEMMGEPVNGEIDSGAVQCEACNNLPADAAEQCRQALGC